MITEFFTLDDLGVTKQVNKKVYKKDEKYKCTQCNINRKKGCFRTINNLICIGCEKKKYGNKLPKLPKSSKIKVERSTFSETKTTGYGGVYIIECRKNNKKYIGESSNLRRRKSNYVLGDGYINPLLKKDIQAFGINAFSFNVLAVMQGSTKDERLEVEAFYKAKYSNEELYNILPGIESKKAYQKWKEENNNDCIQI